MACVVNVINGTMDQSEKDAYIARAKQKYGREPFRIDAKLCGDEVELTYDFGSAKFNRLRRITGYLVGDVGRWNNAKRSELDDRVKHAV